MSATLQEVALAAGVSAQTVSRVINNQPHVSGKARRKVLEAIRLLGYTPSESARILRSGGRMKLGNGMMRLGHIVPPLGKDYWHFERERLQLTEAFIRGGMIQTFCLTSDVLLKDEHLFHYVIDPAKVDALFITMCSDELQTALDRRLPQGFPIVTFNRENWHGQVYIDFESQMGKALEYLYELGHRRIGFLGVTSPWNGKYECRYRCYLDFMRKRGLDIAAGWAPSGGDFHDSLSGAHLAEKLLASECRPTALVAASSSIAISGASFLLNHGVRIPEELSLIAIGSNMLNRLFVPSITCFDIDYSLVGNEIVRLLKEQHENPSFPPVTVKIPNRLLILKSTMEDRAVR